MFVLYTTPLSDVISRHSVSHHLYADDTQLLKSFRPNQFSDVESVLEACTDDTKDWMTENQLRLNDDKTEALSFSPSKTVSSSLPASIAINDLTIPFSESARNLGFILDDKLSMKAHIAKTCQTAFFELKRISSIRHLLSDDAAKTLVTSFVLSRLDYCNGLLMGVSNKTIQPLQKIQNSAARLVSKASRRDHVTPLLFQLHWLPVAERITYKIACVCYNIISGSAPAYLSELVQVYSPSRTLRSSSDTRLFKIHKYNRKCHGARCLACYGPSVWNSLPLRIRHSTELSSFKVQLKTYLFSKCFADLIEV